LVENGNFSFLPFFRLVVKLDINLYFIYIVLIDIYLEDEDVYQPEIVFIANENKGIIQNMI